MNISIFGGSGFIGYDFVKHVLNGTREITPTIYSTNAGSLTNLARHDIDIQVTHYGKLKELELPSNTEYLINFAHPFSMREGLTPTEQISILTGFFKRQLQSLPNLKLIHVSSMSVYEPFAQNKAFEEQDKIHPPKSDKYATGKAAIDEEILSWSKLHGRIQIVRPTVVYGPFCVPWTDNIIRQFIGGPILHLGLHGKIQPVWVADISKFLMRNIDEFKSGVYNIAGNEIMTWKAFLTFFEELVDKGSLRDIASHGSAPKEVSLTIAQKVRSHCLRALTNPFFREVAIPFLRPLNDSIKQPIKRWVSSIDDSLVCFQKKQPPGPFCQKFFEEDRLVSLRKFRSTFPGFSLTPIQSTAETMKRYINFRYPDDD